MCDADDHADLITGELGYTGTRRGNNFMGPTLWPADLRKFAISNNDVFPSDVTQLPEGSHLDMIHQMPYAMGVAWVCNF